MNDLELLRMAAKSIGLPMSEEWDCAAEGRGIIIGRGDGDLRQWNPLADDGEAFRLSVALNLETERSKRADRAYVGPAGEAPWVEYVNDEQDLFQATRRAIVCAAALIGKAMP